MEKTGPYEPRNTRAASSSRLACRGPHLHTVAKIISALTLSGTLLLGLMCAPQAKADVPKSSIEARQLDDKNKEARASLSHGDYVKAEALFRTLVKQTTQTFGAEHPKTLQQRHDLAEALLVARYYGEAETEFRNVWKLRVKVLGPKNADTLLSHFQLAVSLCSQHRHLEAEAEYRTVLSDEEQVLGINHAQTLQTDFRLAQCLQMQGRFADAKAFASRAYEGAKERFGESSVEFLTYRMLWRQLQD